MLALLENSGDDPKNKKFRNLKLGIDKSLTAFRFCSFRLVGFQVPQLGYWDLPPILAIVCCGQASARSLIGQDGCGLRECIVARRTPTSAIDLNLPLAGSGSLTVV